jgi:Zn-dependent protease with chaperone function
MALAISASASPAQDPLQLEPVVEMMRMPGVHTTIKWTQCGEVNAYYSPRTKSVTLCYELLSPDIDPAFVRFVLAHELAHGVIMQRDIPYTSLHEAAADELAAVMLLVYGDEEAVRAASSYWYGNNGDEDPWDPHPSDMRRAITLYCLAEGATHSPSLGCTGYEWQHSLAAWMKLLGLDN